MPGQTASSKGARHTASTELVARYLYTAELPDPVTETVYEPFFRRWAERFTRLRFLQQGKVHVYLVYIMLIVVLALAWLSFVASVSPVRGSAIFSKGTSPLSFSSNLKTTAGLSGSTVSTDATKIRAVVSACSRA